jgi:preprotein translocase subunit SecG
MYQLMLIIAIIVCVLLVLIVLIQNPKGGGLTSNFSSSSQLMGVQKTGDFLEKGTWGLAIFLMVLSLAINVAVKGGTDTTVNANQEKAKNIKAPANTAAPAQAFPGIGGQPSSQPVAPAKPNGGIKK